MKSWIGLTAVATTVGWASSAAAETPLDFDMPVALAQAENDNSLPVPLADGLSFALPPAPEPSPTPEPELLAVLLPVPAMAPPVSSTVAPAPLPPAPNQRLSLPQPSSPPAVSIPELEPLFVSGSDSLVARALGHAEGTRTASGQYTAAYYGHRDPGNQAWNLGTFSYQHGAETPEAADAKQSARLRRQAQQLQSQAQAKSLSLTVAELLNGIDLANQAPVTALEWGYIDRLHQAKTMGLIGDEAILWARTRAFLDPDSGRWNAPGLGNTVQGISRDQERRMRAIAAVLVQVKPAHKSEVATRPSPEEAADWVINLDLE